MKTMKLLAFTVLSCVVLAMCGCAAGSKGTALQPETGATTAVVTLSIQGALPSGSSIGAADITLNLPGSVAVRADQSGLIPEGVVVPSGSAQGALIAARYIPAVGPVPPRLRVAVIKVPGFGTGEIATLNFDLKGAMPLLSDFSIAEATFTDSKGVTLKDLTATLTVKVK